MITAAAARPAPRGPDLPGQTVVVIGGSAGIGLETARRARAEGAGVILAGRDSTKLQDAASELGALGTATFDANDPVALAEFFEHLPGPIDHVMVTAGRPYYARLIFVHTPLSASLLGAGLDDRRSELRSTLPIGRVVGPADVAALAVHIMTNTALTGATYDIDGGQQLLGGH